jgi:hypothetical protein
MNTTTLLRLQKPRGPCIIYNVLYIMDYTGADSFKKENIPISEGAVFLYLCFHFYIFSVFSIFFKRPHGKASKWRGWITLDVELTDLPATIEEGEKER